MVVGRDRSSGAPSYSGFAADAAIDLIQLPRTRLQQMAEAGREVLNCEAVLAKTNDTVVGEILRGQSGFFEWDHYPPGEVHDADSHAHYYYHAHSPEGRDPDEHGHFHTFIGAAELPAEMRPLPVAGVGPDAGSTGLAHLIAISMNRRGEAYRLFTTNRWVTGESWYRAKDVILLIDGFTIGHARPSWPANRWLTAMLRLFRPQIVHLLEARDRFLAKWARDHPGTPVTEDRRVEIVTALRISVPDHLRVIEGALAQLGPDRIRSVIPDA